MLTNVLSFKKNSASPSVTQIDEEASKVSVNKIFTRTVEGIAKFALGSLGGVVSATASQNLAQATELMEAKNGFCNYVIKRFGQQDLPRTITLSIIHCVVQPLLLMFVFNYVIQNKYMKTESVEKASYKEPLPKKIARVAGIALIFATAHCNPGHTSLVNASKFISAAPPGIVAGLIQETSLGSIGVAGCYVLYRTINLYQCLHLAGGQAPLSGLVPPNSGGMP